MKKTHPTVLITGGGSGGHVTPLIAVSQRLMERYPDIDLHYVGCKKDKFLIGSWICQPEAGISLHFTQSGKLRRYVGLSKKRKLQLWKHYGTNLIDLLRLTAGIIQSVLLLIRYRPSVVFSKGGYPALPVCVAAGLLRVPLVTHDSDAVMGLTHRLVRRFARKQLFGVPVEHESATRHYVGVPIKAEFTGATTATRRQARSRLGIKAGDTFVLVTGGGLGAKSLNEATLKAVEKISAKHLVNLRVHIVTGSLSYSDMVADLKSSSASVREHVTLQEVSHDMPDLLLSSDIAVVRAGATTLAEVSALGLPCIVVPNGQLPGGQQTHNARSFIREQAALVLSSDHPTNQVDADSLAVLLEQLLADATLRASLSRNISKLGRPGAANEVVNQLAGYISA